eukprot:3003410-Prymnesium_polylepis.1
MDRLRERRRGGVVARSCISRSGSDPAAPHSSSPASIPLRRLSSVCACAGAECASVRSRGCVHLTCMCAACVSHPL